MIQEQIKKLLEKEVLRLGASLPSFSVEVPNEKTHGDYSTNVAMALSRQLKKSPLEIGKQIAESLQGGMFEKVEVAPPGFINFYLADSFFVDELKKVKKDFGFGNHAKGWKVMVEHTQPNPFKAFHIGHLMNNAIGESVTRVMVANGAKVKTASYHGDVGLHVAKAVWAMQQGISLQDAYAAGHKAYEENENAKEEILKINSSIYSRGDKEIVGIYEKGRKESLAEFEKIYQLLGSKFDYHFYESQAGEVGKQLVLKNVGTVFAKGQNGAVIFEGEKFEPKTHTRVFLNSEGLPTYEAKEVGLAKIKRDKFGYDASVTITANEQDSFFGVVEVAIGQVFPETKGKLKHLSHGMLKLPTGKMSSRTGNIITAEFLIDEVKKAVLEKMDARDFGENEKKEIAQAVAIGAIKYSILHQSIGSDIVFDLEKSISFEGDSGPYLQYSYARACSVLAKARAEKIKPSLKKSPRQIGILEKLMHRFPDVVARAGKEYQPHVIASYITELAREFNNYYANNKIVEKGDEFSSYKVALTEAFTIIMKNGLWLLGIAAPEKM